MRIAPDIFSRPLVLIILFALMMGVVYSPVLYFDYVFHDDATFWVKLKEYGFKHMYFDRCISECRYGDALLVTIQNFFIHKVSDLKFLRLLAIIISSGSACLLFQQMRRLLFSNIQAFLLISVIFFLPGFSVLIFNAAYSSIISLCILMACWSFHRINTAPGIILPAFSFLFAISIYPPAAMFYWVMAGMDVLFAHDTQGSRFKSNIFRSIAVGLACIMIYALSVFSMHFFYPHESNTASFYNPFNINHDMLGKLQWFFQEPLVNALNLWNIFPKKTLSIAVSGFIILTAWAAATKGRLHIDLRRIGLLAFIFFLAFLPNLAAKGNAAFYRCLIPLSSLIWLVLAWSIFKWADLIPTVLTKWSMIALLSLVVVYAGITTYDNVLYYRVLPSTVEWNAYKSMAEQMHFKKADAIYILLPYQLSNERYDEFNILSSDFIFDIYHLIYCAFKETGGPYPIPAVYCSFPESNHLINIREMYYTKLADGTLACRDINKDEPLHAVDKDTYRDNINGGIFTISSYQKKSSKRQNWYILNLKDLFSLSNYKVLFSSF